MPQDESREHRSTSDTGTGVRRARSRQRASGSRASGSGSSARCPRARFECKGRGYTSPPAIAIRIALNPGFSPPALDLDRELVRVDGGRVAGLVGAGTCGWYVDENDGREGTALRFLLKKMEPAPRPGPRTQPRAPARPRVKKIPRL